MEINKSFDELKQIFSNEELAEKLIPKKNFLDLKNKKINSIKIEENSISCTYSIDSKYSYNLKFIKTDDGLITFSVNMPALVYLIPIGGFIGYRFMDDFGVIGIFLGIGLFFLISLIFKSSVKNGIKKRMIKRWNDVTLN